MTFVIVYFILSALGMRTPNCGAVQSSSGFADGRHEVSPDSEGIELT